MNNTTTSTHKASSPSRTSPASLNIDYCARRAIVIYMLPNGDLREFNGWVMRSVKQSNAVIARRHRGRNWWHLTNLDEVLYAEEA